MTKSKYLKRQGLPCITRHLLAILQLLRDTRQKREFLPLPGVHRRTIRSLLKRDWIIETRELLPQSHFDITGRGEKALRVYEAPSRKHSDGLCPACRETPVHVYNTGTPAGYCKACLKEHHSKQYALKGHQYQPDVLCPDCGVRNRHVCSTGFIKPYCHACLKKHAREERRRKHARLLERVQGGEFLPCCRCKTEPRYYTECVVYDYCYACYRDYQNDYQRRRKLQRVMQKHGVQYA